MRKAYIVLAIAVLLSGCRNDSAEGPSETFSLETATFTADDLYEATGFDEEDEFPSFDPNYPPAPGAEKIFELSQDYPTSFNEQESFPWESIDFRTAPFEYLDAVLKYSLEGNIEVDFAGQNNSVRKWYHAPWLHGDGRLGGNGREYINGLTRERAAPPYELHRNQAEYVEAWAIGLYNDRGGYTLGQVWKTLKGFPDPSKASFPPNTVAFKLLFTDATIEAVPFLENSLEWTANIYPSKDDRSRRINRTVRVIQIDISVREPRLDSTTGWVFGTFVYDASVASENFWDRMAPVGLSWGDDPDVKTDMRRDSSFVNEDLQETVLNESLIEQSGMEYGNRAYIRYHGLGGRLNGPVDNPISSCISCHGRGGVYLNAIPLNEKSGLRLRMANFGAERVSFADKDFEEFFSLMIPGPDTLTYKSEEYIKTDYSLQLSAGIRNFYQYMRSNQKLFEFITDHDVTTESFSSFKDLEPLPDVTRGGE